jgi:hypothetical protein
MYENLPEYRCPEGFYCQRDGDFRDAPGKCQPVTSTTAPPALDPSPKLSSGFSITDMGLFISSITHILIRTIFIITILHLIYSIARYRYQKKQGSENRVDIASRILLALIILVILLVVYVTMSFFFGYTYEKVFFKPVHPGYESR